MKAWRRRIQSYLQRIQLRSNIPRQILTAGQRLRCRDHGVLYSASTELVLPFAGAASEDCSYVLLSFGVDDRSSRTGPCLSDDATT